LKKYFYFIFKNVFFLNTYLFIIFLIIFYFYFLKTHYLY